MIKIHVTFMTLNILRLNLILCGIIIMLLIGVALSRSYAQETIAQASSNTPLVFSIPSTSTPQPEITEETITIATASGPDDEFAGPMLQAIQSANVRADGDINAQRLGEIVNGDLYPVTGRAFRWLRIEFDASPTGVGWVYDELVEIIGDESAIPDLTAILLPTANAAIAGATQTLDALTQIPGGIETATASARFLDAPQGLPGVGGGQGENTEPVLGGIAPAGPLPTFTYPPNIVAMAPTESAPEAGITSIGEAESLEPTGQLAPIVPISVLIGLGMAGLIISATRR
jgi:hypothetical protein